MTGQIQTDSTVIAATACIMEEEDIDPFLEYDEDKECATGALNEQEQAVCEEEGTQSNFRSSPVFNTPNFRFNSNHICRRSRIRKSTSNLPPQEFSLPLAGRSLENFISPQKSPENVFFSQQLETVQAVLEASVNEVAEEALSSHRSDSEEDIFVSLPSTAYSQQVIPSAINDLINCPQPADVSWTSSMATPLASNVTYSNLNTEERNVLLPSEDCGVPVKPRALFSTDANDTGDCHSLNISADADYLQNVQSEKFLKTPKFTKKLDLKACFESPLATTSVHQEGASSMKFPKLLNEISRGSPILSGSDFQRTPNHSLIEGDEDLFDNADETGNLSSHHSGSNKDCSAESTPNIGKRRKSPQDASPPHKQELSNADSFLQDISVTALEEVCKAQELRSALQSPAVTPEKEKQPDTKRKRLLFSTNLAACNSMEAVFKTPETKVKQEEEVSSTKVNSTDDIIPDDSFMEHLAAMNTSIFSEEFQPTTKVQLIKSSVSQMGKFSYSVDQQAEENFENSITKTEPKKIMKEIISSVLALESHSAPSSSKQRTVKSTGNLVAFSQLQGEMSEAPSEGNIPLERSLTAVNSEDHSVPNVDHSFLRVDTSPLPSAEFQTANGNQIKLSQKAIDKGLSVLKEAMKDIHPSSNNMLEAIPQTCSSEKQVTSTNTGKESNKSLSASFDDDQVKEEVKELLKLVNDGENFQPWHEIEDPGCNKLKEELQIKNSASDSQSSKSSVNAGCKNDVTSHIILGSSSHGFCTANGKSILVSEDKLAQAKKLLCETDDELMNLKSGNNDDCLDRPSINKMSCKVDRKRSSVEVKDSNYTTENKRVCLENVSSASKKEIEEKSKISSCSTLNSCGVNENSVSTHKIDIGIISMNISEEALNVVNNLFGNKPSLARWKPNDSSVELETSKGFSTACKAEEESEWNFNKSKIAQDASGLGPFGSENAEQTPFRTVNGNEVCISKPSVDKIRDHFPHSTKESLSDLKVGGFLIPIKDETKNTDDACFTSASGKRVAVSEMSMARVKNLFNDISAEDPNILSGFEKKLTVSKQAIKREEDQSESSVLTLKEINSQSNAQVGFSTASGKAVDISEDSFKKIKNLFDDIPIDSTSESEHLLRASSAPSNMLRDQNLSAQTCKSFAPVSKQCKRTSFGSRKSLKMSKPSPVKKVDNEIGSVVSSSMEGDADSPSKKGFLTASGKAVNVSEQALDKVKKIFSQFDLEMNCSESIADNGYGSTHIENNSTHNRNNSSKEYTVQGFSTASGRSVSISKEALNKVQGIFNEELLPPGHLGIEGKAKASVTAPKLSNTAASKITTKQKEISEGTFNMAGFSTAGGKAVQISKEAMTKVKNIFNDLPNDSMSECCNDNPVLSSSTNKCEIVAQNSTDFMMGAFSTAGGKSVHISKKALSKAQSLFENLPFDSSVDSEENNSSDPNRNKSSENHVTLPENCAGSSTELVGFSTAAGKAVPVSKEAMEKARYLLDESPSESLNMVQNSALLKTSVPAEPKYSFNSPHKTSCFTTAGGKSVHISKEALKKAENLFEELPLQATNTTGSHVLSVSDMKFGTTNSVSNDSGVGLSFESFSKSLRSNTSLAKTAGANAVNVSCFPSNNKENQNVSLNQDSKIYVSMEMPKSSLTQEITASTAAFLADDEFFDEAESMDVAANALRTIKTSPSMVSDRFNSLKPILSSAPENKSQPPAPTSPILVRSDSMGTRRRTRKGRLSLSSNSSVDRQPVLSENCNKSRFSLPPKITSTEPSPLTNSVLNRESSGCRMNSKCNQDITRTSDVKETSKLPPSRKLFDHGGTSSAELDTPNAKSIGIAPLRESSATPTSTSSDKQTSEVTKPLHQAPLIKRTLARNLSCSASGFKTPYKTTNNKEPLKRSPSSPAQNEPEAKKRKSATNLYVSHILYSSFESTPSGSRDLRPEVAEMRRRAAEEQKQLVENFAELKGELLKPRIGIWFANRSGNNPCVERRKMIDFGRPANFLSHELFEMGLQTAVVSINADTAAEFRFSAWDYYSEDICKENVAGLPVGDGALLVLDAQGTAGVEEFTRAFLASPGVDPSLVPRGWVKNHYRWIVWKLAALERTLPYQFGKRCLLPHTLMLQLKYRYDREVDRCQRPALCRILEHDDSAAKRIVFCVAGIIGGKDSKSPQVELELTDGWYSIIATIDPDMQHRVRKGMIKVGTKLITHGAELVNCSEGCSPLQASPDIRLKLCSNSTRRARWYTKLGFQDNPGPIKIDLDSILSSGGVVSCFSAYVARVYPIVYMEKTEERTVVRSQRAESKEMTKSEKKRQQLAEVVYSQVQNELQLEHSKKKIKSVKCSLKNLSSITSGEELCNILESSADPLSVQCMLNEEQKGIIADYQRLRQEELRSEMEARVHLKLSGKSDKERQVTAILKVRLIDCSSSKSCSAMLSVWRPSEDISSVFKEGQKITIFSAVASGLRCGDLQLSASRSTRYHVDNSSEIKSDLVRTVFPLDLSSLTISSPRFGELDIVGIVIRVTPAPQTPGNTTNFQTAYVSDSQYNILGITFWEGIKVFAVEDLITPRALIAATNLQWRAGSGNKAIPSVYVSEFSFFTTNPKPAYLHTALQNLRRSISNDIKMFCKTCDDKLDKILSSPAGYPRIPNAVQPSSTEQNTPVSTSTSALHHESNPNSSSELEVKAQQRLSVDSQFESPSSAGISPAVEKRIAKLEKYGDPPPISPILICQPRRSLKKAFKAPRRTDSPSSLVCKKKD
ncbi:breast cancer type 2 susceptibility protein homolog isoform X1 [Frankliniella occidentalis]|uniref:Breast cancer type 2 susceptibility protein homolog isoform X1 n=2 Tax=Frankliniella occidentalis TaxID=133901 RepID=A0A9C6U334_FRAOC|nr:breast cancer type 2 susceptibility protein homolog isoform X1 [Frankliniella occidentalis]